jgi:hypothetical protein
MSTMVDHRPIHHVCYLVDDLPSAVGRWVAATGAGPFIHLGDHVTFEETLLDGTPCVFDHAAESARLDAAGMPRFLHLRQGDVQIALHESPLLGHPIEVHEDSEPINALFGAIAAAAEGWDGSDQLRPLAV